ncbi:MAG: hypothetical protein ACXV3F_05400 [Frankiaceae bacterium]
MRLIFEYDGDDVRLVSQQRVDVVVTGFDIASGPQPGNYVEMRSDVGEALARVPVREAFTGSAEVFPERPGEQITRVDVERPHGAFTVVLPAPEGAKRIAVVRVPPTPPSVPRVDAGATSPFPGEPEVRELATFPLELSD